jgi:hypothetical protein
MSLVLKLLNLFKLLFISTLYTILFSSGSQKQIGHELIYFPLLQLQKNDNYFQILRHQ